MCNPYAIFTIHCIGKFLTVHFETEGEFMIQLGQALARRPRMTRLANGGSVMKFVAINADAHRCNARCLRHRSHIRNLSVARLALHPSIDVFAVCPGHPRSHRVDAHPRNGLPRLRVGGEFLDGGLFRGNDFVAGHTFAGCGESHHVSRFGICVARIAFQTKSQVCLVAIRDRLSGRHVLGRIVGHFILSLRRSR